MRPPNRLTDRRLLIATALLYGVWSNVICADLTAGEANRSASIDNNVLGLPPVPILSSASATSVEAERNTNRGELIKLGADLFYDKRLSVDGTLSCAGCHQPGLYFSDGLRVSLGVKNQSGTRNAPSLLNVAYNTSQFWDGRDQTLEQQALRPFVNPREMAQRDFANILKVIRNDNAYRSEFVKAFNNISSSTITMNNVAIALATFQRTLNAADSPFDRFLFAGDLNAIPVEAQRGYKLFTGAAACAKCHTVDAKSALFSDNQFHALSVGLSHIAPRLAELSVRLSTERLRGVPTDNIVLSDDDFAELGRFIVTLDPKDIGTFRTPSLRNVAMTAPYMHDGSIKNLAEAVDVEVFYRSNEQGHPLLLTPDERHDLIAFLETLTSSQESLNKLMPTPTQRNASGIKERTSKSLTNTKSDHNYAF